MVGLARLVADDPADVAVTTVLGHLYWHRYERHGAQSDLNEAVRMLAPHFVPDRVLLIPDGLRTEFADAHSTHVETRLDQALTEGDVGENLSELAVWCWFLLEHADPDNDRYGVHLGGLGMVLYMRYEVLGDVNALLQAIGLLSRAARVTPAGHPSGLYIRGNLAIALARRHGLTGSANDLRTAFEACLVALREPLATADRDGLLGLLAPLLRDRVLRARTEHRWDDMLAAGRAVLDLPELRSYAREAVAEGLEGCFTVGADKADLDEAIRQWTALQREVSDTYTALERAYVTMRRGDAYCLRYRHEQRPDDLDVMVDSYEQALAFIPDEEIILRLDLLHKLAIALLERIERQPTADDIERAVTVIRAGLADQDSHQASPHFRTVLTRSLLQALWHRYILARRPEDLDEAAELLGSAAVREVSSADGVLLFGWLAAKVHRARYRAGQGLDALQEAVVAFRKALGAAPEVHPARPGVLVQFGISLVYLYQHTGDLAALDEAVDHAREAVRAVGEDQHHDPAGVNALYLLGAALAERGARTGSLDDLNDAVRTLRRLHASAAVIRTRELHGLGFALTQLFDRTRDSTQLDEAVDLLRRAVELWEPDKSEESIVLSALSNALLRRYDHSGGPTDLDEALVYARRAADAAPTNDPVVLPTLTSLVGALREARRRNPERVDVGDLVALSQRVVDLAPPDHAALGMFQYNLGLARKEKAEATEPDAIFGEIDELPGRAMVPFDVKAVADLARAARSETIAASLRIRSAQAAAAAFSPVDVLAALRLLGYAVELIPLAAPRRIAWADQQHAVKEHSALV
ncbi:hypothetical protein, partial [Streptomyces rochei]